MIDYSSSATLTRLAITAALNSKWEDALEHNKELQKLEPENIECLNRLAKAYFELGKYLQAKKIYQQVLKLDPYNFIAQKNFKKVSSFKKNVSRPASNAVVLSPAFFLEEPGITRVVSLIKAAEPHKLLTLSAGTPVKLVPKNRGVSVMDMDNQYLGVLPDDTAHHLLRLINGGNKYQAIIKSIKQNSLTILIRETFRSKKFKNQPSFIDNSRILTYSSQNIPLNAEDMVEESEDQPGSEELTQ